MDLLHRIANRFSALLSPAPPSPPNCPNPEYDPVVHAERVRRWQASNNDEIFRTNYPCLNPASIVLDLGGYHGHFALAINAKYGCRCQVFEVVPELCENIRAKCAGNPRIVVHEFGLAGATREETLFLAGEGSSTLADRSTDQRKIPVRMVAASPWLEANVRDQTIDLMKINIEGGEYELLEHLLSTGWSRRIRNIQVQFHEDVIPRAARRMERIQSRLAKTHRLTYQERFIWENWEIMSAPG
jgi:FkbM family methyltransferase